MKLKRKCLTILLLTLLTMSFCYVHVKEAYAIEYEFETGFEESDPFAEWTPDPVFGYGYEIQTTIVHGGVNACRSKEDTGSMTYELASNYSKHYSMVYFYINGTAPDAFGGGIFIRVWDPEITVYIETNASRGAGKSPYIRFYDQMDDDFSVLDSEGLTLGAWHTVAVYIEGDSASANHKCWVDGRLMASVSDDTSGYNVTGITIQSYWWTAPYTGKVIIDDFASNDAIPMYYFNFNFKDLDSEDVELYVDWALWNSTHDLGYTEGETSLYNGTYYLKTSKYELLINTTTLTTEAYGNSTINIYLNMKRHQSCPNGFIVSNDTISSITVYEETPQLLNFTIDGNTPAQISVGVAKNASHIIQKANGSETLSIAHVYDDAMEYSKNTCYTDGWNQVFANTNTGTTDYCCGGLRFLALSIPSGATIETAKTMLRYATYYEMNSKIYGELTINPENFNDNNYIWNTAYRPRTTAYTSWVETCGAGWYDSPSLTSVLQEIIDQDGWASGQDATILFIANTDSNNRSRFYSRDNSATLQPKLNFSWKLDGNLTGWTYLNSPSHIQFNQSSFSTFAFVFPSITDPVVGPHTPMNNRVKVNVRLNGEWLKGCNVTVEGGPDNRTEWALTDVFGGVKFKLKTGSYEIVASYEEYSKSKPVYVSTHMTIGIDLTKKDIISPDVLPKELFEDMLAWLNLPELDLTSETFLVFIIPLIVLVVYAVKKASEGPKRKWKYSYLK